MAQTDLADEQRPASANAFKSKVDCLSITAGDPIKFTDKIAI